MRNQIKIEGGGSEKSDKKEVLKSKVKPGKGQKIPKPRKPQPGKPKRPKPRKPLPKGPRKPKPVQPRQQPLPYYPSTGSNKRPGGMTDNMKATVASRIQAWQDRNVSNRGSKLNP